jgi:non-specific serine/threonine protein kinase/serine/threonine-protein kinase
VPVERWQRVKDLVGAALERSAEARAAFVREACAGDEALRREVESLVAAGVEAGAFLSQPAVALPSEQPTGATPEPTLAGRCIGPYRLLSEAGRGGMGVVYRSVRDDDVFRKTVALKLVRGGASPEHLRRLGRERQILARLQHPNIAGILDGGTSSEGQPYLVMEYVEGEAIDAYCDRHGLRTRERLSLFRGVCSAVQYAHQNLVVHRDLKPSNILVTAEGEVKLLDFGIARLLAAGVDPDTAPTATLLPMLTPAYASPEQVRGQPVTTASDVYSLGVVLYELLTGALPYPVRGESLEEVVRAVCSTQPAPPSAVRGDGTKTVCRASPAELRGDLDTIVLKALRKEPERRYASAQELAEDVRRHIEALPVLARADTPGYRLGKFVRRHRTGVAAASLVAASLLAGIVATSRQARIAELQRARADRRFADVRELARAFLVDVDGQIQHLAGATPARHAIVEKGLAYLDRLSADAEGDSALQVDLAYGYTRIGDILGNPDLPNLGDPKGARASYDRAAAIARAVLSREPRNLDARLRLWSALSRIGVLEGRTTGIAGGLRFLQEALEVNQGSVAASPDDPELVRDRTTTLGFIARLQLQGGDRRAALSTYEGVRRAALAFQAAHPEHPEAARDLLISHLEMAQVQIEARRHDEAAASGRAALALAEAAAALDPSNGQARRDVASALHWLAHAQVEAGHGAEALPYVERGLHLCMELSAADPKDVLAQRDVVVTRLLLGRALAAAGRPSEGLALQTESLSAAEVLAADHPQDTRLRSDVADSLRHVGELQTALGRQAAAVRTLTRGVTLQDELARADRTDAAARRQLADLHDSLGAALSKLPAPRSADDRSLWRDACQAVADSRELLGPANGIEADSHSRFTRNDTALGHCRMLLTER